MNPAMNLSGIKLVVTDMDGTLLNNMGEISPKFFPLLEEMRNHDIRFAVASGRQYYTLRNMFDQVKEDLVFIADNGAITMKDDERIHIQAIDPQRVLKLVKALKGIGEKHIIVCGVKTAYVEQTGPLFLETLRTHFSRFEVVRDLTDLPEDEILNVTVCNFSGAEEHTMPQVEFLKDEFQVKLSGDIWVDFTHEHAHKGNALHEVQRKFQITPDETMVFGDYLNDLELFDNAAFSFAMANAHEQVKQKARFLAESNEEEGVVKIIEKMLRAKNRERQVAICP